MRWATAGFNLADVVLALGALAVAITATGKVLYWLVTKTHERLSSTRDYFREREEQRMVSIAERVIGNAIDRAIDRATKPLTEALRSISDGMHQDRAIVHQWRIRTEGRLKALEVHHPPEATDHEETDR